MSDATALDKLIEAVEAGTADGAILFDRAFAKARNGEHHHSRRAYQGSLDAALALHEALLPGHWLGGLRGNCGPRGDNFVAEVHHVRKGGVHSNDGVSSTPARAWLLAILRAYRQQLAD